MAAIDAAREDGRSFLRQSNWPNHDEKGPPKEFFRRL
jgi:hypothetical protein